MVELVLATGNQNKVEEIKKVMPAGLNVVSLAEKGITEEIPEDQATIEGNAIQKARYVHEKYGFNCLADDTGLIVASLDGDPGVYSARYAGPNKDANDNMELLLKRLKGKKDRGAHFLTVMALATGGNVFVFEGKVDGIITEEKFGDKGFGYDPIFIPEDGRLTFAEMSIEDKNAISHRGRALNKVLDFLNKLRK